MPSAKDPKRKSLAKELEEEENVLKQCFEKLKSVEASRVALVSQLREALHEQVLLHIIFSFILLCISKYVVLLWFMLYTFADILESFSGIRTGEC